MVCGGQGHRPRQALPAPALAAAVLPTAGSAWVAPGGGTGGYKGGGGSSGTKSGGGTKSYSGGSSGARTSWRLVGSSKVVV